MHPPTSLLSAPRGWLSELSFRLQGSRSPETAAAAARERPANQAMIQWWVMETLRLRESRNGLVPYTMTVSSTLP
jgi:hypothetical protein